MGSAKNSSSARVSRRAAIISATAGLCAVLAFDSPPARAIVCQSPCVPSGDKVVLALYWSAARGDNMTVANGDSRSAALGAGYVFARNEGQIFKDYKPGLVPLRLYYQPDRADHYSVATSAGLSSVYGLYQFVRLEGWLYPTQQSGTVPLYLYWNAQREDNFVTATAQGIADAEASGYQRIRVEGYIFP